MSAAYGIISAITIQTILAFTFLDKIKSSSFIFSILQYMLSLFLLYMGISKLFTKNISVSTITPKTTIHPFIYGLLVEILNPFALIFFLSVFTPYILINTFSFKLTCLILFIIIGLIIYSFFALLFNTTIVKNHVLRNLRIIEKISAVLFISFAIKVLLTNFTIE